MGRFWRLADLKGVAAPWARPRRGRRAEAPSAGAADEHPHDAWLRERMALRGKLPATKTWRRSDGSVWVVPHIRRYDGKVIAGGSAAEELGVPWRDVMVIDEPVLTDREALDYVLAIDRYARRHGKGRAFLTDNLSEFSDALYLRGLGDRACRVLGRDHPGCPGPMRPIWAMRVRRLLPLLGRQIGCRFDPNHVRPEWLRRVAPHLFLDDSDWQAWEYIRYVRRGFRPDMSNLAAIDNYKYQEILRWVEGHEPPPNSELCIRADLLWLKLHFENPNGIIRPRATPATRAELKGLL